MNFHTFWNLNFKLTRYPVLQVVNFKNQAFQEAMAVDKIDSNCNMIDSRSFLLETLREYRASSQ